LNNFPPDSIESNAARALLAVTMFLTYPRESLVARHVLVRLIYGGNIDGEVDDDGGPHMYLGCLERRHVLTLGLYVMTLIPAFFFDDLGPVLSITGSLGGSCLSYIAPGMVYLGVNGDFFLEYIGKKLDDHRKKKGKDEVAAGIELPVAGDAGQIMQTQEVAYEPEGSKPLWWYPLLMPMWCSLASTGRSAMKERLVQEEEQFGQGLESPPNSPSGAGENDEFYPLTRDYWIAIFFIVFGFIAAVAGLASNIYVQVNNIFFSPH
jgi:sodium-coupled neutral amino acid transporter 11